MATNVDNIMLNNDMQFNTTQSDILYMVLSNSQLASSITGEVRKANRVTYAAPVRKEDCIISSLSIEAGSVQLGTSHVNIIVPDKTDCTAQGNGTTYSEDGKRIKLLAGLAYDVLQKHYCENGWSFTCVEQDVIAEPTWQAHRIWFKIRFIFHN